MAAVEILNKLDSLTGSLLVGACKFKYVIVAAMHMYNFYSGDRRDLARVVIGCLRFQPCAERWFIYTGAERWLV